MSVTIDGVEIIWLKHDAFLIKGGNTTIVIDPYQLQHVPEQADLILITHEHFDHCDADSVRLTAKKDTVILAPEHAISKLHGLGTVKSVKLNDSVTEKGVNVKVVPAYNVRSDRQQFHPKTYGGVGYLITLAGKTVYHAGDTDVIPEMKTFGQVDIALLPVSGTYVMDAQEAAEAVKAIKPTYTIPMHWGTVVGNRSDAEKFAKLVSELTKVCILEPTN